MRGYRRGVSTLPSARAVNANQPEGDPDKLARWHSWTRPALIANLIGQIMIVLSGGLVRLTGSGLGCSTWPECEPGSFVPQFHEAISIHPYIEFGNRLVSLVLVLFAVAVAILVWTNRSRSQSLRVWGLVPLIGVLIQAVIGGITVRIDLHPAIVGGHLLGSMALVAASTYLLIRWNTPDGPRVPSVPRLPYVLSRVAALILVPILVLGVIVTGAGPHSGDDEVGYRFGFDPQAVTRLHAISVWLFLIVLVMAAILLLRNPRTPGPVRSSLTALLALTVAQGLIGYVQYFTDLPILLVALHMLAAAGLTAVVTWFVCTTREQSPLSASLERV